MGTLFKAVIGFAIALTLLQGKAGWAGLDTRPLQDIRSAIVREHPQARLGAMLDAGIAAAAANRFGTTVPNPRAHRLHS